MNAAYQRYLLSAGWHYRRAEALAAAGYRCAVCNCVTCGGLNVHHRTYARLGSERPSDLVVLCRGCHELFHQHRRFAPGD